MDRIPHCPSVLPAEIGNGIRQLGRMWADSNAYPAIDRRTTDAWKALIEQWARSTTLPLLVRKSSLVRGSEVIHAETGRRLVPCDNSPAQWACHLALLHRVPTLDDIVAGFKRDEIPVSFAHKKQEEGQRKYHCTLGRFTVNKADWKLCHIEAVGLGSQQPLESTSMPTLVDAFKKLIDPGNFFLVPKRWGGLGEAQEFIEGVIQSDS